MTKTEQQIWDLVHEWCKEQSCEIPDFNRRALMQRILSLQDKNMQGHYIIIDLKTMEIMKTNEAKGNAVLPLVVRSYFKNCGGCGQITTSDRWILKTERNIKDHYRPICKKCAIWAELPVY